ncbi:MAG: hypothetical protein M3Q93_04655 [Gemmatimonadota bacterium]|nr:hypothetical protein [Gemmatimonadota bacterium]
MKREALLKLEHAHLYPGVAPSTWEGAGVLADKVLACRLLLPSGGFVLYERALHPEHFEFRGGTGPRLTVPDRLALDSRAVAADSALTGTS